MKLLPVLLALLLCSCEPPIKSGVVVQKDFTPAHTEWDVETLDLGEDQSITVPVANHIPDEWTITIKGENEKGQIKTRTIRVTHSEYNRAVLDQCWPPLKSVE